MLKDEIKGKIREKIKERKKINHQSQLKLIFQTHNIVMRSG
jgi:hypothetical protein